MWKKALLAATVAGLTIGGQAQARDLTVTAWGGTSQEVQRQVYFKPFTAATGIPLTEDSYNGGLAKVKAMVDTNSVSWDVVQVEAPDLLRGCEEGLFEKLDWTALGGRDKYIPSAVSDCGVGTIVWSSVLAYNADKIKEAPASWADFWDTKKYPGKRGLRKGAKFTMEIALLADGVAPDKIYDVLRTEEGKQRAFKKLDQIKPQIQWWEAGAQPAEWLAAGDVTMSSAYNGRIRAAQKEGKNFKVVWNGQIFTLDSFVIVKGSPNKDAATKFIAFASAAENQVKYPPLMPYGATNKDAIAKTDPAVAPFLPTSPENMKGSVPNSTEFWVEFEEELDQRFNAWAAK